MPVEFKDYYATLGVPRTASAEEIKSAFRKLARKYHPDVAHDKKAAEQKFKEINEANEVLSDPEKRRKYDQLGAGWKEGAGAQPPPGWRERAGRTARAGPGARATEFHFGGTGFSDFFEQFFGGGGFGFSAGETGVGADEFRTTRGPARGSDIEGDIMVTLEEAMQGSVRSVSLQRTNPHTGQSETHTFKVRIPAGVQENQIIRVPGKGDVGAAGGESGDLYLRVRLAAHPDFSIRGADLYYDLALAPWEAVLGTIVNVPTLETPVSVRIPPGSDSGRKLRVAGRGLPKSPNGPRGDLYVIVKIALPHELSEEERGLWEKLSHASRFNPRNL